MLVSQHKYQLIVGIDSTRPPLILLHGSGRDEEDMAPLAAEFSPQSTAIAVRSAIPGEEGYAFFRRFADRSIGEESILRKRPSLRNSWLALELSTAFKSVLFLSAFRTERSWRRH